MPITYRLATDSHARMCKSGPQCELWRPLHKPLCLALRAIPSHTRVKRACELPDRGEGQWHGMAA